MKLLITGASQPLGSYFCNYFNDKYDVISYDTLLKESSIPNTPDVIIHSYEISNINYCERNENISYISNTIETKKIASLCNKLDIPLIYISTAHVFSGKKNAPYYEDDICDPINIYGKTKLYGEQLIRTICAKYFIIRTSSIWGEEQCFVKNIIKNNTAPLFQYSHDILSPIYIDDLCQFVEEALNSTHYGIYHCTNNSYLTIEKLTEMILGIANVKRNIVYIPSDIISNSAKISSNTALASKVASTNFKIKPLPLEERLKEYIKNL